ncbi:putative mitochondrial-processing peptidase subunit alpha protein [Daldinia childiae]|uniref:putative mitochondrial-processing peptidase subunit alpha protein n=1 Tax=Daldinia childiae TaxID=326645 RepID=UPI001445C847|nr:putative mitochondrial-processing peptidase subunit alpha protein [Daldinia childiae]KAF3060353.1 putative mitochondrial-processing peptidase subunit alpha protein [Daldinia childiae]
MKQREEDVESQAQLLSKESQSPSSEEFDYDEPENSHQNQSSRRRRRIEQNPLWRRIQSFTLPIWAPCRKFSPKYYVFAIVVSLLITLFIFNPYSPTIPTQHQTDVDVSPGTPTSTIASSTKAAKPTESSTPAYKPPKLEANDKYCTTWPIALLLKVDGKKPAGIKVIGMVFYGRKRYVDLLDCYLQQNLASNGGYFDEVWFMAHTKEKDDVSWIEDLVQKTPGYKIVGKGKCEGEKYKCMWTYAVEDKTIYVKIDDDIVYIHPDAIPQLVHTRIALPHPYAISSNLVNSPVTGMEQYHYGAIHPFLPDPSSKPSFHAAETWRASEKKKYPKDQLVDEYKIMDMEPSYRGHPWLLISDDHYDLLKTPMGKYDQNRGSDPIAFGLAWKSWAIGAQQQYSLLYNLEQNKMQRYFFGRNIRYPESALGPNASAVVFPNGDGPGGEQTYDTGYNRYNLNFCAVWGSDIRDQLPIADDDEQDITADIPRRIGRPFVIDTRSVVGHFSFFTQKDGINKSDLLDRWRAFANEAVCTAKNQKKPWDLMCPDFKAEGGMGR